uniref:Calcium-binding protein 39-like protein n=1 Tax=Lygus hesperus TaxID=30085 RepID=A0A0A9Z270_LYGHE
MDAVNNKDDKSSKKAQVKCTDNLNGIKIALIGDGETEPKKENVDTLAQAILDTNFLTFLVDNMCRFEFESRKDIGHIIIYLLRNCHEEVTTYITANDHFIKTLVAGYENQDIA